MELNSLQKMDAHLHFNVANDYVLKLAEDTNFKLITVNVDFPEFGTVDRQLSVARKLYQSAGKQLRFIASFSMESWWETNWVERTIASIREALNYGAVGVKIWKNIGMTVLDETGELLSVDDPRLDPLFDFLEEEKIPLMMHQAEPKSCWLPLDEITMLYDRAFFTAHPKQHMYLFPDKPIHEKLIRDRDRRLKKHPNLVTVQAHLGSMEWDVDIVEEFLQSFPNAYVDLAARINYLMFQSMSNRDKVRDFFIRYQSRILYATDFFVSEEQNLQAAEALKKQWQEEWRFLSSPDKMVTDDFKGSFYGLALPDNILKKIYLENALRAFPLING
jgi:predicted TIM-barrel fold metal-dependent hydrolase